MKDLYSSIASSYSSLVKTVFGNQLFQAKTFFLKPAHQNQILIIGGGDGLDYRDFASDLNGDYWELSSAMLELAQRNLQYSQLNFHLGDFAQVDQAEYDEVWLHFVLDTLPDDELEKVMLAIKMKLKPTGKVYLADFFAPQSPFQRLVHVLMVGFFRLATKYPRKEVPQYESLFTSAGFEMEAEEQFRKGWIRTQVWKIKDTSPQPSE